MRIGLFIPCFIDAFFPEVGVATLELLERFGHQVDIKVQVAALRHAVRDREKGSGYISTVAGRGDSFVAPVSRSTK